MSETEFPLKLIKHRLTEKTFKDDKTGDSYFFKMTKEEQNKFQVLITSDGMIAKKVEQLWSFQKSDAGIEFVINEVRYQSQFYPSLLSKPTTIVLICSAVEILRLREDS